MADGYPDKSKQRRPGMLKPILNTAKAVQGYADSTREVLDSAQTGTMGKMKWDTNLFDMLGESLYGSMLGKQSFKATGKSAMELALFGIDFDINPSSSVRFETAPGQVGRDYNLTFTKKF